MHKMTKVQNTEKQSSEDTLNVELVKFPGISMFGTKCGWLDLTFLALTEDGKLLMQHRKKPAMVSATITDRVRSTTAGYVFTVVCPSTGGGYPILWSHVPFGGTRGQDGATSPRQDRVPP